MAQRMLPPAKRPRSIVEWRFSRSHRYWDDCGKLITVIEQTFPGLVCQGLKDDGFHFEGESRGITGAVFYWDRASVTQTGQGDSGLASAAAEFWAAVHTGLGPNKLNRVGHRTWICFPTDRPADAQKWLDKRSFWSLREGAEALGTPQWSGTVFRTRLDDLRRCRIEMGAGTIKLEGKVSDEFTGVIVDVDVIAEPPGTAGDDVAGFIRSNMDFLRGNVESFLRGA